ncbi:MAG: hypothetical protein ACRD4Q_06145 [Candidatus Acidiferrales bacterium]
MVTSHSNAAQVMAKAFLCDAVSESIDVKKDFEYKEVETGLPDERALDVAAAIANIVPLIGGPIASIIGGISAGKKEQRILEAVQRVSEDLHDFTSQAAEEYVKTEDFEELLENTLRRVAQERSAQKRRLYSAILTTAIKHPGGDYDDQLRFLKTLDELDPDHIKILRSLLQQPEPDLAMMGSPMQTLRKRIPAMAEAQIEQLVNELNDRRIASLTSLRTIMTAHGAANLQHAVTPYGRRFLSYVAGA